MKVALLLAPGFEEIEAITPVDVLRRLGIVVDIVSIAGSSVLGAHNIAIEADLLIDAIDISEYGAVICPGGLPGSDHLAEDERVISCIQYIYENSGVVGAVCAAPRVLARAGILDGKRVSCYPGKTIDLFSETTEYTGEPCTVDGRIVTGSGVATVAEFSFAFATLLTNESAVATVREKMLFK